MSIKTTKRFFDENAALRDHVEHFLLAAHELPMLAVPERIDLTERIVAFLADMLLPHTAAEERVLYPEAHRLLASSEGGESVAVDRAEIRHLLSELADADAHDTGRLQELLYALYAILSAHFWRKEEVYVRLLRIPAQREVTAVLDRVAAYEQSHRAAKPRFPRRPSVGSQRVVPVARQQPAFED